VLSVLCVGLVRWFGLRRLLSLRLLAISDLPVPQIPRANIRYLVVLIIILLTSLYNQAVFTTITSTSTTSSLFSINLDNGEEWTILGIV
jgi:hypothetical protein